MDDVSNRPWPVPDEPWTNAQSWLDLCFLHWRVDETQLRKLVPDSVELDTHDGSTWLGITPFRLSNFRLRGLPPIPGLSTFPEVNVRTYVTRDGRPGIWFFSLDAASRLAVEAAKKAYKLPYHHAEMRYERVGEYVEYESSRAGAAFGGRYRGDGNLFHAEAGTLEYFLTERYCLYTEDGGRLYRAEIHHPPWDLQRGDARVDLNTMAPLSLLDEEPDVLFCPRQDVVLWSLDEVE
jgi:uncharacterized protein